MRWFKGHITKRACLCKSRKGDHLQENNLWRNHRSKRHVARYRRLKFGDVKRILFLMDRGNLGKPTEDEFADFVKCYCPGALHWRKPTRSEANSDGRWRCYDYKEQVKRDKLSLDLFWIKDPILTDTDSLPPATELADELDAACDLFAKIAAKLPKNQAPHFNPL